MHVNERVQIPGYDYGAPASAKSPVSRQELLEIEQTIGWTDEDAKILRQHQHIFVQHAEQMVDAWRSIISSQPHLLKWFVGPDGQKDEEYAAKVKPRFVQWVIDACQRPHDQEWLNYQEEIGLRHTPAKKNLTDHRETPPLVPLRFLLAFVPLVIAGPRQVLIRAGLCNEELRKIEQAWAKTVQIHLILWSGPYAKENLW
jgi:hypothetical protein